MSTRIPGCPQGYQPKNSSLVSFKASSSVPERRNWQQSLAAMWSAIANRQTCTTDKIKISISERNLGERQSIAQKDVRAIDARNSQLENGSNAAKNSVRAPGLSTDEREHPFVWYFGAGWKLSVPEGGGCAKGRMCCCDFNTVRVRRCPCSLYLEECRKGAKRWSDGSVTSSKFLGGGVRGGGQPPWFFGWAGPASHMERKQPQPYHGHPDMI